MTQEEIRHYDRSFGAMVHRFYISGHWTGLLIGLILAIFSLAMFYPLFWLVFSSFKTGADIVSIPVRLLPRQWTLSAYQLVMDPNRANLPRALKVRIVAPESVRASNLVRYHGLEPAVARHRLRESDREREAFRRAVARNVGRTHAAWLTEPEYDLVMNAAAIGIEPAARLMLRAAQLRFGLRPASMPCGAPIDAPAEAASTTS